MPVASLSSSSSSLVVNAGLKHGQKVVEPCAGAPKRPSVLATTTNKKAKLPTGKSGIRAFFGKPST
jgi:hypothetical protein